LFQQQQQQQQQQQDENNPNSTTTTTTTPTTLDTTLSKFQNFMVQPSGAQGVDPTTTTTTTTTDTDTKQQKVVLEIQPRIVLNILHAVLKGDDLTFPRNSGPGNRHDPTSGDPYFYPSDYDHVLNDDDDNDDDDDNGDDYLEGGHHQQSEMKELMVRAVTKTVASWRRVVSLICSILLLYATRMISRRLSQTSFLF
jgi:hypothetical protein